MNSGTTIFHEVVTFPESMHDGECLAGFVVQVFTTRLGYDPPWEGGSVRLAQFPYTLVVRIAQCRLPRFPHTSKHDYNRPRQAGLFDLCPIPRILEEAEQPELLSFWSLLPYFEISHHRSVHRLPIAAARETRGRRGSNGMEHCHHVGLDAHRTAI
jgi:hypothetical protein